MSKFDQTLFVASESEVALWSPALATKADHDKGSDVQDLEWQAVRSPLFSPMVCSVRASWDLS